MGRMKKFWIIIGIIALSVLLIIGACFAFLYFKPGSSILGLKYVNVENRRDYVYRQDSDHPIADVDELYINTERCNITFLVSGYEDVMNVTHINKFAGFTRDEGTSSYSASVVPKGTKNIFNIYTSEKYEGLSSQESFLYIYLPTSYSFTKITAISQYGNISITTFGGDVDIPVDNIILSTANEGNIYVNRLGTTNNVSFATTLGDVVFNQDSSVSFNKVEFNTKSGSFKLKNSTGTILNATDKFVVNASGNASINIGLLNSNLELNAQGGDYFFDIIGSESDEKDVIVSGNNINFAAQQIYGMVSLYDNDSVNVSNKISINAIDSTRASVFTIGKGSARIKKVRADISISSTSGSIYLSEVDADCDVYAYSISGPIRIDYVEADGTHATTNTRVISKTGGIQLNNISGKLYVEVLGNSKTSNLAIAFNAIYNVEDNFIISKDRDLALTWSGNSDALICRLYTKNLASFYTASGAVSTLGSEVTTSDVLEHDLEDYPDYSHQYRIGYGKGSLKYAQAGKLFVDSSRDINIVISR